MKIGVVMGYMENWTTLECHTRLTIIYPERLHPFVDKVVSKWRTDEEERIQSFSPDAYLHSINSGEVSISVKPKKEQRWLPDPEITRETVNIVTRDPQMTKIWWSPYYEDKDFLIHLIQKAHTLFLEGGDIQEGDETIEFIPIIPEGHIHGGRY